MYIIVIIQKGEREMRALICDGGVCRGDQTCCPTGNTDKAWRAASVSHRTPSQPRGECTVASHVVSVL